MSTPSNGPLSSPAPSPSAEAKEAAWTAAVSELRHQTILTHKKQATQKLIWPLAAAASIAALCALYLTSNPSTPEQATQSPNPLPDLAALFNHGNELFDGQLQAVTVSQGKVVWHLNNTPAQPAPPQTGNFITLAVQDQEAESTYIATIPGAPIPMELKGTTHLIEFLPEADGNIIAYGDGIYWNANGEQPQLTTIGTHEIR